MNITVVQIGVGFTSVNWLWTKKNCIKITPYFPSLCSILLLLVHSLSWERESCCSEKCVMRSSAGSRCDRELGEWQKQSYLDFSVFQQLDILFLVIFLQNVAVTKNLCSSVLKCSLGFPACRCAVIYFVTIADSEAFICNTNLKLLNF